MPFQEQLLEVRNIQNLLAHVIVDCSSWYQLIGNINSSVNLTFHNSNHFLLVPWCLDWVDSTVCFILHAGNDWIGTNVWFKYIMRWYHIALFVYSVDYDMLLDIGLCCIHIRLHDVDNVRLKDHFIPSALFTLIKLGIYHSLFCIVNAVTNLPFTL